MTYKNANKLSKAVFQNPEECPFCKEKNVDWDERPEMHSIGIAWMSVKCFSCQSTWHNEYHISGATQFEDNRSKEDE